MPRAAAQLPAGAFIVRPATFALLAVIPLTVCLAFGFLLPLSGVVVQSLQNAGGDWSLSGFRELLGGRIFPRVLATTLETAAISTAITLAVSYPVALYLSRQPPSRRAILLSLVLVPFWTSILVKSFGFTIILGESGVIRGILGLVLTDPPRLLFNRTGVVIGFVHFFVPYMVFPILANLLGQRSDLPKAAAVMGASRTRIFWTITLPLSLPSVAAGCLLTFVTALGFFITPALLGGRTEIMIANLVDFYTRKILDWTLASGCAVILLVLTLTLIAVLARLPGVKGGFAHAAR